jgi:hypothetical protein
VRLGQVNDRDVPGPVVSPGGAWIGVPHGALEVAERPAGIEVQRREGVSYHARSQVAGQIGRQAGPCGEVAHDPPYVGGKQPPPRPGGEQHRDVCQIGSPGEIGVYPGSSRAGEHETLALAIGAGNPQHPVPLVGAEVPDVGADDFRHPGAGE